MQQTFHDPAANLSGTQKAKAVLAAALALHEAEIAPAGTDTMAKNAKRTAAGFGLPPVIPFSIGVAKFFEGIFQRDGQRVAEGAVGAASSAVVLATAYGVAADAHRLAQPNTSGDAASELDAQYTRAFLEWHATNGQGLDPQLAYDGILAAVRADSFGCADLLTNGVQMQRAETTKGQPTGR